MNQFVPQFTVAQYALQRLAQLGIDSVFAVPCDYAFAIDDAAENVDGLSWVACANELNAVVEAILARLQVAGRAHAMVTPLVTRYGVRELASELIANANLPVFTTPNDIGTLDASMPQSIGMDYGVLSSSQELPGCVAEADLILDSGGVATHELNTGFWTHRDRERFRETVILNDQGWPGFAGVARPAGHRPDLTAPHWLVSASGQS
jgi:TPP-dependent 2-oxoacid decarboxylase